MVCGCGLRLSTALWRDGVWVMVWLWVCGAVGSVVRWRHGWGRGVKLYLYLRYAVQLYSCTSMRAKTSI